MSDDASPENLRKFLESDDPALVLMGLSMAKGSGVPDELLGLVAGLYMWNDDKTVRAAAKSTFMKFAPDELKQILKETWKIKYRTLKNYFDLKSEMINLATHLKGTSLDTVDLWIPAFSRTSGDKVSVIYALGKIGDKRAVEPLTRVLKGWRTSVDSYVSSGIWKDKNWPPVIGINYGALDTFQALEDSFVEIGEAAVDPLIKALNYKNDSLVQLALEALGQIKDKRAVEPIIKKLAGKNEHLSYCAAKALGDLGDERSVPFLIVELEKGRGRPGNRNTLLRALYKLGDVRGIKGIIRSWYGGLDIWDDISIIQEHLFGIEEIINALGKEHMFVDKTNEYHEFRTRMIRSNILNVLTVVILDGATVSFTKKQVGRYWNFLKLERGSSRERLWKNQKSIKKALKKLGHEVE